MNPILLWNVTKWKATTLLVVLIPLVLVSASNIQTPFPHTILNGMAIMIIYEVWLYMLLFCVSFRWLALCLCSSVWTSYPGGGGCTSIWRRYSCYNWVCPHGNIIMTKMLLTNERQVINISFHHGFIVIKF